MKPVRAHNGLHPDKYNGTRAYAKAKPRKFTPTKLVSERRCSLCEDSYRGSHDEHLLKCPGLAP